MTDFDVCTLGAAKLDPRTNACVVQAVNELDGNGETEPFGEVAVYGALGVWAMPAPADKTGHAEAIIARGVGNADGAVVAARDVRTASTSAQLAPGETCVGATGKGFEARTFYKDQLIAHVIGDDMVVLFDRKAKKYTISLEGLIFEMSAANGIVMTDGGASLSISGGTIALTGNVVLGGMTPNPAMPVLGGPGGAAGACVAVPGTRVFLGLG